MHVLPTDLHDVGRNLYIKGAFMVNLCMIIESASRSAQNAKARSAHLDVQMSIRAFAFCAFLPADPTIMHRSTMKPSLKCKWRPTSCKYFGKTCI